MILVVLGSVVGTRKLTDAEYASGGERARTDLCR
jgi:hypothetical protein